MSCCFKSRYLPFPFERRVLVAVVVCVTFIAVSLRTASAQESLRKVVYGGASSSAPKKETPRKKAAASKKTASKAAPLTKRSKVATAPKKRTVSPPPRRHTKRPGSIDVVFESPDPNTQIFLNGNLVGATDKSRTFRWNVTPGLYRIRGVLGTSVVFPETVIQLRTDKMKFTLKEAVTEKIPEKKDEPPLVPLKTQAEIEMELARQMSARVLQIFNDFLDPQKSAAVTTADWRFAASAAVLGEFQNLSSQQIEAQRKFASGQVALAEGDHQRAFGEFRLAIQTFPESPMLHIGVGDTYAASAQWQDARKSYEQARTMGPNFWMAHRRLGDIYRLLEEKKKAVLSYADAIKAGDARYETRFLRARAMVDAENFETVIPLLEELLKEKPTADVYVALGETYEMSKRDVAALDNYRKAVELDPNSAVAQYRLARVYYEQREFQKAVEGFDAALKLDGAKKSFPHDDAKEKRANAVSRIKSAAK
jgi:tetratricopeptide (TPR) repeat protein